MTATTARLAPPKGNVFVRLRVLIPMNSFAFFRRCLAPIARSTQTSPRLRNGYEHFPVHISVLQLHTIEISASGLEALVHQALQVSAFYGVYLFAASFVDQALPMSAFYGVYLFAASFVHQALPMSAFLFCLHGHNRKGCCRSVCPSLCCVMGIPFITHGCV